MADLSITAASVARSTGTKVTASLNAGATLTQGMAVYLDASQTWQKMQCDGTALESGSGTRWGITLSAASSGQPVAVLEQDGGSTRITIGATIVKGGIYVVSAAAGLICPIADLATGNYLTILGYAHSTTILEMQVGLSTGITMP